MDNHKLHEYTNFIDLILILKIYNSFEVEVFPLLLLMKKGEGDYDLFCNIERVISFFF